MAAQTETEAEKMRRVPGIVFADGATGRRARVGGTGIDVWEVIQTFKGMDEDWDELRARYDWLSEEQLRAAITYWRTYPDEIEARVASNASWTQERVWAEFPETRPRR